MLIEQMQNRDNYAYRKLFLQETQCGYQKTKSLSDCIDLSEEQEKENSIFFHPLPFQQLQQQLLSLEKKSKSISDTTLNSEKRLKRPSLKIQASHFQVQSFMKLSRKDDQFSKQYELMREIGSGRFAQAMLVNNKELSKNQQGPALFVAKDITIDNNEEGIMKEWNLMKDLQNDYIIKSKEIFIRKQFNKITFIMEYFPGLNLYSIIKQQQIKLSDETIIKIIYQLLQAVSFLHSQNIIHRDISLENVLFSEKLGEIRLIDFGISLKVQESLQEYFSPTCNPMCSAPEVLTNQKVTNKIDMYAIGIILLSLLKKKAIRPKKVKSHLTNIFDELSEKMKNFKIHELLVLLLHQNPELRISANDALKHFFKNI